jgi:tetratricopeptide (TPR) repeat protein
VLPDLTRFTFTGEGPLNVPADALGYSSLVLQALEQSPLLYVFRTGPESLANVRVLYGPEPAPEPDPWTRAVPAAGGQLTLAPALPPAEARKAMDRAKDAKPAEALEALKEAAASAGPCPGVHAMLADAALAADDLATAEQAAQKAIEIDAMFAPAHRALAEVRHRRADRAGAKQAAARALALYPASQRAWKVAAAVVGREIQRDVGVPAPFIDVHASGAVVVVSCERPLCERYAACKAAMRFEPGLRAAVLAEQATQPYHLSVTEEVVCLEAGLGAYVEVKRAAQGPPPRPAPSDPSAEMLLRLAKDRGLASFALFEILGKRRPEWLRVAPKAVHEPLVRYVETNVLGEPAALPPAQPSGTSGGVTARLEPGPRAP